jgi:RNA polymerase sigma-70 factor (ECF subfamily)
VKELSDHELFELIDQGRDEAFGALLAKHYGTLYAFAFKYCRHQHDAEDIVQEALLKISRCFQQFKETRDTPHFSFGMGEC